MVLQEDLLQLTTPDEERRQVMMSPKEWRSVLTTLATVCALLVFLVPNPGFAGSLDPPANAVDASGNPVPTMRSLNELRPSWSGSLNKFDYQGPGACNSSRFKCIFNNKAVLDMETGLVWSLILVNYLPANWSTITSWCTNYGIAVTSQHYVAGWRLPSIEELRTLFPGGGDLTVYNLGLFNGLVSGLSLWSSSDHINGTDSAYVLYPYGGNFGGDYKTTTNSYGLCVRGPK